MPYWFVKQETKNMLSEECAKLYNIHIMATSRQRLLHGGACTSKSQTTHLARPGHPRLMTDCVQLYLLPAPVYQLPVPYITVTETATL